MPAFNPRIFREYDIRGVADREPAWDAQREVDASGSVRAVVGHGGVCPRFR